MKYLLLSALLASCVSQPSLTKSKYYREDATTVGYTCPINYYYSTKGTCMPLKQVEKPSLPVALPKVTKKRKVAPRLVKLDCKSVMNQVNQCSMATGE